MAATINLFTCASLLMLTLSTRSIAALPHGACVRRHVSELSKNYDYIIAGGGTSGLTVADRLTAAFPSRSVLVVEYGQLSNDTALLRPDATLGDQRYAFNIFSKPQRELYNRTFPVTVGKIVGGSTAINAQMFDRGSAADYDAWGDVAGSEYQEAGWNWRGLIPYFKKSVTFTEPASDIAGKYGYTWDVDAAYGGNGTIQSSFPPFQWPVEKVIRKAWQQLGVTTQKEAAGGKAYGVLWLPSSQDPVTQTRSYARTGHFDSIANRSNYHLLIGHMVTEVVLGDTDSDGDYESRGVKIRAVGGANSAIVQVGSYREVILAAGGIHTPGILQRSGIGANETLKVAGIVTKVDLPGVGQNFQDHAVGSLFYNMTTDVFPNQMEMFINRTLMEQARKEYDQNRTGPLTLSGGNSGAFLSLSTITNGSSAIVQALEVQTPSMYLPSSTHPTVIEGYANQLDSMKDLLSSNEAAVFEYPIGSAAMIAFLKPLSRGSVNIDPTNLLAEPIVDYRTFSNPLDVNLTIAGIKMFRRMFSTPSARTLGPVELFPGPAVQTDAQWATYLKRSITPSFYHPVGTAALGLRSRGGVLKPNLKVHGVADLRVVDASIMPLIPGTHTSSTVYAVAEKAADLIIRDG